VSTRGLYVVIEGIDGTGKTELAARLVPALIARGHSISSFHEPADKFLRDEFRRLKRADSFAAALCLTVDREMIRPQIERALEHGDVVVQDRSFYSTLAYQYAALSADNWRELERIEMALAIEPDVVLYLDAPVDLAVDRVAATGQVDPDEGPLYLERVRRKFEQLFQPPRWVRIDARGTPERTLQLAMNVLMASGL
jgi:dTMP kinase